MAAFVAGPTVAQCAALLGLGPDAIIGLALVGAILARFGHEAARALWARYRRRATATLPAVPPANSRD